ncbi:MAG: FHA domain-containing protein [Verrucomicrobia bacterium]|nr:FHA domain-containing protein [Verrucomicrobiota bacterium]
MRDPTLRLTTEDGQVRDFVLRPGANSFGRRDTNDYLIDDASVSGRHCEVTWNGESVQVRDLGSTNGTFIDGRQVTESTLAPGQVLRLGSVDLCFLPATEPTVEALGSPNPQPKLALRVETPSLAPPIARAAAASNVRVGLPPAQPLAPPMTFFQHIPGAFIYPFSTNGIFLLIGGTVLFAVLGVGSGFFRGTRIGLAISIVATGYLFAYMQKIISASAQGEKEMPGWPEFGEWWSDIVLPFLLLMWTCLVCFVPAFALLVFGNKQSPLLVPGAFGLLVLGGFYFPMALMAVAVTDSFLAVNPAVLVPSIARVIGPYLVTCLLLGVLFGVSFVAKVLMAVLPVPILPNVVAGFVSLYLLAVEMRLLGLLFFTHRARLGWFS